MKGIAHFASGLVVASFVPGVAEQAALGSLLIALGGACAMLPDWLDFKFARFLERRDADLAPDPALPGQARAQALAEAVAAQLKLAQAGPRIVQLHPVRRGAIDWLLYTIRFDVARGDVVVTMDDALTNGEQQVVGRVVGRARAGLLDYTYDGDLAIIELGGPSLRFAPVEVDGRTKIRIEFLPWHRTWSHSLVLAVLLGLVCGWWLGLLAGLVAGLGFAVHVLEDQLGYMGSNLFWPLTRGRSEGLHLLHSGDTIPNLVTVWLSITLLLLNLDRARAIPLLPLGPYLTFVVLLPTALLIGIYARRKWRQHLVHWRGGAQAGPHGERQHERQHEKQREKQRDLVAEIDDAQA